MNLLVATRLAINPFGAPQAQTVQDWFIVGIALMLAFQVLLETSVGEFVGFLDELCMLAGLALIAWRAAHLRLRRLEVLTLVFLAFSIVLSMAKGNSSVAQYLPQSVINWKLFLYIILLSAVPGVSAVATRFLGLFLSISLLGLIANILMQEGFVSAIGATELEHRYRFEQLRIVGFQLSSGNLGLGLALCYLLGMHLLRHQLFLQVLLTVALVLSCVIVGVRSPLLAVVVGLPLLVRGKLRYRVLLATFLAVPAVLVLLFSGYWEMLVRLTADNVGALAEARSTNYIRGVMIVNGLQLAQEHFPFGAGAATFGSVLSGDSPIYGQLGLAHTRFVQNLVGIFDSNLASVLGEYGFAGIGFYGLAVLLLLRKPEFRTRPSLAVIALMVAYSLTYPVMTNGFSAVLFSMTLFAASGMDRPGPRKR